MKVKQVLSIVLISAATAILSVWGYSKFVMPKNTAAVSQNGIPANYAGFWDNNSPSEGPVDFSVAANRSVPAVVHIKAKAGSRQVSNNLPNRRKTWIEDFFGQDMDDFFGDPRRINPNQAAFGSGVFISEDGYIITNNHVIEGAEEFEITTSEKKQLKAKLVGTDPSTDLAVLKVEGKGFPFLLYGNSDNVKLGQWVLAIGYPLNLETTVTAGIISAKGRRININGRQSQTPIESFLQTDAAVNPGNSGGALVNTTGELIGINSAIASPTGSYAGYSYAIPINLVKKIVNDIMKFGSVKRGYLGIAPDAEKAESGQEALVAEVAKDGGAAAAGIKKGDVITRINNEPVRSWNELQAQLASQKVGDKVNLTYRRNGQEYVTTATMLDKVGTYDLASRYQVLNKLGAELVTLDKKHADELGVSGGVLVKKIKPGGILSQTNIKEGFVIFKVNNYEVNSLEELGARLERMGSSCMIAGVYPGYEGVYQYGLNDLK
jgi:serine protease Do